MNLDGAQFLKRYRAVYLAAACIRRVTFEAACLEEAQRLATGWGFGLEGETEEEPCTVAVPHKSALPEAYGVEDACRVMGGISRTTLYRLLVRRKLERVPATRKVLVTRRSIERFCAQGA